MIQPLYSERLTKKFLMSLPPGVYLASNVALMPGQPIFAETVVALGEREAQWKRIVAVRVNNQLCNVFQSPEEYIPRQSGGPLPQ
jgi:hypothetical protein